MQDTAWLDEQTRISLNRLLPRIKTVLDKSDNPGKFLERLNFHFPRIFRLLLGLYGSKYDFFYHLEQIMLSAAQMYVDRPEDLKQLDKLRESDPTWFLSEKMVGGVCYVDLFAGDLIGVRDKIPYFQELGINYLHLMPLFKAPRDNNDGGYAVSDYRSVNPDLGTMQQLAKLATELRENGISLVLDFVFNHTSNEHEWAMLAKQSHPIYSNFYHIFDNDRQPQKYAPHLREIFPEQDPGSFTYYPDINKWVWTTFRNFQWDLNYHNPEVFNAMMQEMLFLANQGVEILRLDAVAFIWKQAGTTCENLPQSHQIIQAYNALTQLVAPAMLFKSEAIVHPAQVAEYISWEECPISYNPTMMALLWESLATRKVELLRHSMMEFFAMPEKTTWVNYVRVHDDIGWSFADESAQAVGINGYDHRYFLNMFYTGKFNGSFARGLPFNYNPVNQDMRISGTSASLAGLEQAISENDPLLIEHSLKRLQLIHSVIISAGGIPLIYIGDELAMLNDYGYRESGAKSNDSRWVHRPKFDWEKAELRHERDSIQGRMYQSLRKLIQLRLRTPELAGTGTQFFDTQNIHVLGYTRQSSMLILANFSERKQVVSKSAVQPYLVVKDPLRDLISDTELDDSEMITLDPYQFIWLKAD